MVFMKNFSGGSWFLPKLEKENEQLELSFSIFDALLLFHCCLAHSNLEEEKLKLKSTN